MPKAKTYGPLLLHRFGPDILNNHYKIEPDALEEYRLRLHLSTGEVRLIVYLWNKWKLYEEKISLPVKVIAGALHISASQVRRYTHALKEKGLLDVSLQRGRGKHNWYDLRPLWEKLRALVRGFPLPRRRGEVTTQPYKNAGMVRPKLNYVKEELWSSLDSISRQFKDSAPKSSLTRAARIFFKLGLPLEAYKVWIQEARQRTKDFWAGVDKPMPYFFAILEQGPHARMEQPKEEPAAPASDGAAFYWDDSPLPETDQTVLQPIGANEAPPASAPVSIEASAGAAQELQAPGLVDAPALPSTDQEGERGKVLYFPAMTLAQEMPTDAPAPVPDYLRLAAALQYPRISVLADDGETWRVVEGEQGWNEFRDSSKEEQERALYALHKKERSAPARVSRWIDKTARRLNDSAAGLL